MDEYLVSAKVPSVAEVGVFFLVHFKSKRERFIVPSKANVDDQYPLMRMWMFNNSVLCQEHKADVGELIVFSI
jgi:hypothetical protein